MNHRKIHILGPSGSGKSYLADKISGKSGIKSYDLDDLFWDNSDAAYNKRNPPAERDRLLGEILTRSEWIIEGVYYKWPRESFDKSEIVIFLDTPYPVQFTRILLRFLKRKLKIQPSRKKKTITGLIELMRWNRGYNEELRIFVRQLSEKKSIYILKGEAGVNRFIKKWPDINRH